MTAPADYGRTNEDQSEKAKRNSVMTKMAPQENLLVDALKICLLKCFAMLIGESENLRTTVVLHSPASLKLFILRICIFSNNSLRTDSLPLHCCPEFKMASFVARPFI